MVIEIFLIYYYRQSVKYALYHGGRSIGTCIDRRHPQASHIASRQGCCCRQLRTQITL